MREFIKVDVPAIFPSRCLTCHNAHGPLIDTGIEVPPNIRVYLCGLCVKRAAEEMGYAEGTEMDRLNDSFKTLKENDANLKRMDKEVRESVAVLKETESLLTAAENRIIDLEQEKGQLQGLVDSAYILLGELATGQKVIDDYKVDSFA